MKDENLDKNAESRLRNNSFHLLFGIKYKNNSVVIFQIKTFILYSLQKMMSC